MIVKLCKDENLPIINIVRRTEQVDLLKELGAEHILNSSEPDFLEKLGDLAKSLKATVCFEAVAGELTGQVLSKMPFKSICYLYGLLSE